VEHVEVFEAKGRVVKVVAFVPCLFTSIKAKFCSKHKLPILTPGYPLRTLPVFGSSINPSFTHNKGPIRVAVRRHSI
jgi:hypothetical protein